MPIVSMLEMNACSSAHTQFFTFTSVNRSLTHLLCNNILDIDIVTLTPRQRLMAGHLRFFDDFLYMILRFKQYKLFKRSNAIVVCMFAQKISVNLHALTDSQQSKSNRNTAHRLHLSSSRASVNIFVTKHSKLFCSSKILRAKFNKIWLRRYSWMDISNSCAFWMPIPQNVKYRRNTSTSWSVNSPGAINEWMHEGNREMKRREKKCSSLLPTITVMPNDQSFILLSNKNKFMFEKT